MTRDTVWQAARRGDLDAVREFIARDGVPDVEDDYDRQSLLTLACEAGHVEVVRFLLGIGRLVIIYGRSPEAFAAARYARLDVLELLHQEGWAGACDTEHSKHGPSLFFEMFDERNVPVVRWFVERDPELLDALLDFEEHLQQHLTEKEQEHESSPALLELAARAGDVELARFLIEVGARVYGESPDATFERAAKNALSLPGVLPEQKTGALEVEWLRRPNSKPELQLTPVQNFWFWVCLLVLTAVVVGVFRAVWMFAHVASWPEIALWSAVALALVLLMRFVKLP
jgi:hypothetical protein